MVIITNFKSSVFMIVVMLFISGNQSRWGCYKEISLWSSARFDLRFKWWEGEGGRILSGECHSQNAGIHQWKQNNRPSND